MSQNKRIVIAVLVLLLVVAVVLGIEEMRRRQQQAQVSEQNQSLMEPGMATAVPGSIPIILDGKLVGSFEPADLEGLEQAGFQDTEEGKTQEGWLLRDVLLLFVDEGALAADMAVTISSSHRDKSYQLTWAEIDDLDNMVLFDLSGRGTLKLVSLIPGFDVRDAWVQDVDRIEIE